TRGSGLYLVNTEGEGSRRLAEVDAILRRPRMDPSGRHIRFTAHGSVGDSASLWQVDSDGSRLRKLSPIGEASAGRDEGETDGSWTPDGRIYLFRSVARSPGGGFRNTLWAMREPRLLGAGP